MDRKSKLLCSLLILLVIAVSIVLFIYGSKSAILNPKGMIAKEERDLMYLAFYLMWIVVIPVFVLTILFVWKYRENKKNSYDPEWDHSKITETLWWGVPCIIIFILAYFCGKSCYELDPFRPISNGTKPLKIQVIALQWKWLFLYPEQKIATVNYFTIPEKTPIEFEISADAPMNSFWVPELAGQIYAMPGMKAKLHAIADEVGDFRGCSANISGTGFASMVFIAKARSASDFQEWVAKATQSTSQLGQDEYNKLAQPSSYLPESTYLLVEEELYDKIVMKYMMPM